ncbi:MAG: ABC transporter permease [Gammaproteobacteria bacterium]
MSLWLALQQWWRGEAVLLWTDALLFLLLIALGAAFVYVRRDEPLRRGWRRVLASPPAMASAVLLSAFVLIALLDSLHFRPLQAAGEGERYEAAVLSVLDVAVTPLRTHTERSYSRPMDIRALEMTTITGPDGRSRQEYPRLRYGGSHLEDPLERDADLLVSSARALAQAVVMMLLPWAAIGWMVARRRGLSWRTVAFGTPAPVGAVPWRTIMVTLLVLVSLGSLCAELGPRYHLLGTDKVGNDVLYQSLKGVRTSVIIGTLTTLLSLPLAIALGVAAGYFRGAVDDAVQYLYTTLDSIPDVLLIAAMVLVVQAYMAGNADSFGSVQQRADLRLLLLCAVLGITRWTGMCRLLRGETLKLREQDYVQAAQALGAGHLRILGRQILPNLMHLVLITLVMQFSGLVLAEAVLSYIGIGVDPGMHSWGNMINSARLELAREPVVWWSLAAALALMLLLVLAANLFADAVRDAFDPRATRGVGGSGALPTAAPH